MNDMSYVKATDLNRGKASSCIKKVHDSNCDVMILKNSEPYAVIISVEKYEELTRLHEQHNRIEKYAHEIIEKKGRD